MGQAVVAETFFAHQRAQKMVGDNTLELYVDTH